MRLSAVAFFMILTTVFLSGCSTERLAQVDDRGNNFYSRSGVTPARVATTVNQGVDHQASNDDQDQAKPWIAQYQQAPAATMSVPSPTATTIASPSANAWQWPVEGRVIEAFGQPMDGVSHEGIVIAAREGTPIRAAQAGEVAFVGQDSKTYGNMVILRHADGTMTSYSHARNSIVAKGQRVNAGAVIAYVGQSGNAKLPQLHFAVREGKHAVDPMAKLPQQVASR